MTATHDLAAEIGPDLVEADVRTVLSGHDDRHDPGGDATRVVADGDLGLAVGAKVRERAVAANLRQAAGEAVGKVEGEWHEGGRLVGRVAEHQALVAGADGVEWVDRRGLAHRCIDLGRLRADPDVDIAGGGVKAEGEIRVADVPDHAANDRLDVNPGGGRDLAVDPDRVARGDGFAGNARLRIEGQIGVKYRVRDEIADLVGMTLGDGLRRQKSRIRRHGYCRIDGYGHWRMPPIRSCDGSPSAGSTSASMRREPSSWTLPHRYSLGTVSAPGGPMVAASSSSCVSQTLWMRVALATPEDYVISDTGATPCFAC